MLDARTLAICKMVVETMLVVVKQCILNQTQGYWLLFNALNVAVFIHVFVHNHMEQSNITSFNFVKGDFEFELGALHIHMMVEVNTILAPFLAFASTYIVVKAHNMFALMLDPQFKSLDILKTFFGKAKVIHMVVEYDTKSFVPLLMATFQFLNLDVNDTIELTTIDDEEESIFGGVTSNEATFQGLLITNYFYSTNCE